MPVSLGRRVFLVAWLSLLFYLLYSALVKSGISSSLPSEAVLPAPLTSFASPGEGSSSGGPPSGLSSLLPAFPSSLTSSASSLKPFGVAGAALPLQAPKVPVIFGAGGAGAGSGGSGGAASAAAAAAAPAAPAAPAAAAAPPLIPSRCVDGELPTTSVRRHAPGQVCLRNVYLVHGRLRTMLPPKNSPDYAEVRAYLDSEGLPSGSFAEMAEDTLASLRAAPVPSVPVAGALLESQLEGVPWGSRDHLLAHSYIFIEAAANVLALQALEARAGGGGGVREGDLHPAPLFCCGCGPHMEGVGAINAEVARGLWGAELTRCVDVWGEPPGPRPPALLPGCASAAGLLHGGGEARPWALHMGTLCLTDRTAAFAGDGRVEKWKSFSAGLQPLLGGGERAVIEGALGRLRAHALGQLRERSSEVAGLKDEFHAFIAQAVLEGGAEAGPLITVLQRSEDAARSFPPLALASLHALLRPFTQRLLILKALPLVGWLRLAIAARTDLLVGTHGEDMGLLLFQPRGAAVLELAPHYTHFGVEGTGWTNALGFLSRLKGAAYSGADGVTGPIDPVGRVAEDLDYQMEMPVYVNNSALVGEVGRLLREAKKYAAAAAGGGEEQEWPAWHPSYVSEAVSFPAEAAVGKF